jgi:hypothetical protein
VRSAKNLCTAVRATALVTSFLTSVVTLSAAPETATETWRDGLSTLREPGAMFLSGLALLTVAFVARQRLRKNGPKSVS